MIQIGIDFGGTKIEAAALDASGAFLARIREPNPGHYEQAIRVVCDLVAGIEQRVGASATIGIGTPGSISPRTGVIHNSNSLYLNGRRFREDLAAALGREIRMANDANCLALSEACDGAAAGARSVFAAILGTGCGGGLVLNGQLVEGAHGIAGEWGHTPLPWPTPEELQAPACWCGRRGCLETWISGTGLRVDFARYDDRALTSEAIVDAARSGDEPARAALTRYLNRLARGLGALCTVFDPETIVIGGGMSNVQELYDALPDLIRPHVFSDTWRANVVRARWGDSSGVRGAARLWPIPSSTG
jgi:fructokinase